MKRIMLAAGGVLLVCGLAQGAGLRDLAQKRGFLIGGAMRLYPETLADPQYLPTFAREFNVVVPEHVMKFRDTQPKENVYDFRKADFLVKFAEDHGMKVRGHTLVWHEAVPDWVEAYKGSSETLREILKDHITTEVGYFKGRILAWDVVNEAVAKDGSLAPDAGPWPRIDQGRALGGYIADAFRWAHAADPKALLFYNDWGAEQLGAKSDGVYALLKRLRAQGVPVDGVGFQAHIDYDEPVSEDSLRANFKRFSDLGLIIHITEMDFGIPDKLRSDPKALAKQADVYRLFLKVCLETPRCQAFLTWGLTDKYSWIDEGGEDTAPLLLDKDYRPKPAYAAVKALLRRP